MDALLNNIGLIGNSIVILISIVLLYFGAEWLVKGGSNIASRFGVSPLIVGLTVVAFGTSLPEFVVSFIAHVFEDASTIAIGNIIGSNITNIGLILGLSAVILPVSIVFKRLAKQLIFLFIASIILYVFSLNGEVNRFEGAILSLMLIGYVLFLYRNAHLVEKGESEQTSPLFKSVLLVIAGIGGLSGGAWLFVESGIWISEEFGVSKLVIGLTIVALGTSLPELATSVVAATRGEGDISVGNIVGSNIFNILFIFGGVSLFKPLGVLEERTINGLTGLYFPHYQYIIMICFGLILFPLALKSKIGRISGGILMAGYAGFYIYLLT